MLETIDPVAREIDSGVEREVGQLAPVVGMLVGLGMSAVLWIVVGGLIWLARAT
jgi:hypothetical protein